MAFLGTLLASLVALPLEPDEFRLRGIPSS